jgi:hypothetical protein
VVLKSKTRASYLINLQLSPIEDLPAAQNNIGREAQLGSSRVEAELIEFLMMFNIIQPRNGVWQPHEEIQPTIRGKLTSNKRGFTVHETGWWVQFRLYIFNCSTIPNPFFVKRNIEIRNFTCSTSKMPWFPPIFPDTNPLKHRVLSEAGCSTVEKAYQWTPRSGLTMMILNEQWGEHRWRIWKLPSLIARDYDFRWF